MLSASQIFKLANLLIVPAWLLLLLLPTWKYTISFIRYGVVFFLSIFYTFLLWSANSGFSFESFSTLENVKQLFQHDNALLIGWIHYLAFDLFIATWIVQCAVDLKISRWLFMIVLPITFLFGPLGYFLFISMIGIRKFAVRNSS